MCGDARGRAMSGATFGPGRIGHVFTAGVNRPRRLWDQIPMGRPSPSHRRRQSALSKRCCPLDEPEAARHGPGTPGF